MDNYVPDLRSICLAKAAEQAGAASPRPSATSPTPCGLTREPGDVLQIERWQERLENQRQPLFAPNPATAAPKPLKPLPGQERVPPRKPPPEARTAKKD